MNSEIDYYKILGIPRNATPRNIKKAYRREILKWHPDRNHSPEAEPRTGQIIEAWEILKDPEKKKIYDKSVETPSDYSDEFRRWQQQAQDIAKETAQEPLKFSWDPETMLGETSSFVFMSLFFMVCVLIGIHTVVEIRDWLGIGLSFHNLNFVSGLSKLFGLKLIISAGGDRHSDLSIFTGLFISIFLYIHLWNIRFKSRPKLELKNKPVFFIKYWAKTIIKSILAWTYIFLMIIWTRFTLKALGFPDIEWYSEIWVTFAIVIFILYFITPIVLFRESKKIISDTKMLKRV